MNRAGFAARLAVMVLAFAALAPAEAIARRLRLGWARDVPPLLHRLFLRLFDIRVTVRGAPPRRGVPTLVLANHVSWIDIPVMAGALPLAFIAKREIATWPIFGDLARRQGCIFIDRTRKAATAEVNARVAERLAGGEAIVLFPEGTTGDGIRILPFRSSLVGAARAALADAPDGHILLQPLAIAYVRRNGLPVVRREMPDLAWYGDMELVPHVLGFVRGGPLDVALTWGDPIPFGPETDRKRAARAAETAIRTATHMARRTATLGGHRPITSD